MKHPKRLFAGLMLALAIVSLPIHQSGCKGVNLDPGGAYSQTNQAPDKVFFALEQSYYAAYNVIDAAFKFEESNRVALFKANPGIKHGLDAIRPKALSASDSYLSARAVYIANPIPDNLTTLQRWLEEVKRLAQSATQITAQPK